MRLVVASLCAIAVSLTASAIAAAGRGQVIVVPVKLCTPTEVRGTVGRFLAAFNMGDVGRLDRVFAPEPDFRWYSTDTPGQRLLPVAADRSGLLRYFAGRHARGEQLALTSLRVNGNTFASGRLKSYGNFQFELVRRADDLAPTNYGGKGALHCYASRPDQLIVWSMARAP